MKKARETSPDDIRKYDVFISMARVIAFNFPGWELLANIPGYGTDGYEKNVGVKSIAIFWKGKLMGHRLISPKDDAVHLMKEICGAFESARQRKEVVSREDLEEREKAPVHG